MTHDDGRDIVPGGLGGDPSGQAEAEDLSTALRSHISGRRTPDMAEAAFARAATVRVRRRTIGVSLTVLALAAGGVAAAQVLRPESQGPIASTSASRPSSPGTSSSPTTMGPATRSPSRPTSMSPRPPSSPTHSSAPSQPATSTPAAPTSHPSSTLVATCAPGFTSLAVTVDGAGMGHVYHRLVVTNRGTSSCMLAGYPGVSMVDAKGQQIGAAADRTHASWTAITLKPGRSSVAWLDVSQAANYPTCTLVQAAGLRVYLPGRTDSSVVALSVTGCPETSIRLMQVKPFGAP
jgi:hypothetical protein